MKVTDFAFPLGHTFNSSVPGDPQPISIGFFAEDIQPLETDPNAVCWRGSDPRERFLKAPLGALYGCVFLRAGWREWGSPGTGSSPTVCLAVSL